MTQVNFHPKSSTPVVGNLRFSFVDADTGECIADNKIPKSVCFNTSDNSGKQLVDIVNSFIRGFLSGKNLAVVIELIHPKKSEPLDMF